MRKTMAGPEKCREGKLENERRGRICDNMADNVLTRTVVMRGGDYKDINYAPVNVRRDNGRDY